MYIYLYQGVPYPEKWRKKFELQEGRGDAHAGDDEGDDDDEEEEEEEEEEEGDD